MKTVCVDSGFLIGLYDGADQFHSKSTRQFSAYFGKGQARMLVPWPILYESVSTRLVKRRKNVELMEHDWKELRQKGQLVLLEDQQFRGQAMDECLAESLRSQAQYRPLSLTDRVIRKILSDVNTRIDALITFNPKDFRDVCTRLGRDLIS